MSKGEYQTTMQTLAPLTFHAVPLIGRFQRMDDVIKIFCAGRMA